MMVHVLLCSACMGSPRRERVGLASPVAQRTGHTALDSGPLCGDHRRGRACRPPRDHAPHEGSRARRVVTLADRHDAPLGAAPLMAGWTGAAVMRARRTISRNGDSAPDRCRVIHCHQGTTTDWHAQTGDPPLVSTAGMVAPAHAAQEVTVGEWDLARRGSGTGPAPRRRR